jgi:hypothetical protein
MLPRDDIHAAGVNTSLNPFTCSPLEPMKKSLGQSKMSRDEKREEVKKIAGDFYGLRRS